jgi:hypothetical protein
VLRERWRSWCEVEGHRPGSSGHLTALLMSVDPRIESVRRRPPDGRNADRKKTYYRGIGLNPQAKVEFATAHLMRTGEILADFIPTAPSSSSTVTTPSQPR